MRRETCSSKKAKTNKTQRPSSNTKSKKVLLKTKSVQKVKINNRFKVRTGYRKSYSLFFLFNQFI